MYYLPGDSVLSLEVLEFGLAANPEFWGLLQPYEHLICGRNSTGKSNPDIIVESLVLTNPTKSISMSPEILFFLNSQIST